MIKRIGSVLCILLSIICLPIAKASPATPATTLNKTLLAIHTLNATFQQIVQNQAGTILQKSNGSVLLERPGKFRWTTNKPAPQTILTNGEKLWIYDPDLQQVTIRLLKKNLAQTPMLLLTDPSIMLGKTFFIVEKKENKIDWYQLTPKAPSSAFKQLTVGFKNNTLFAMRLLNTLGQTTLLTFHNVTLNAPIPAGVFQFSPPKGVDVVDMTKKP
jgi:outer membrane lipoprotein carrier protein